MADTSNSRSAESPVAVGLRTTRPPPLSEFVVLRHCCQEAAFQFGRRGRAQLFAAERSSRSARQNHELVWVARGSEALNSSRALWVEFATQSARKSENPRFLAPGSLTNCFSWLRGLDLNQRPLGYEPNELPDCSTPRRNSTKCDAECQGVSRLRASDFRRQDPMVTAVEDSRTTDPRKRGGGSLSSVSVAIPFEPSPRAACRRRRRCLGRGSRGWWR